MDFFESGGALAPLSPTSNVYVLFVIEYIANVPALLCRIPVAT